MNSRPTDQIDCKYRVMADEWYWQKRFVTADAEIIGDI
jgi:hypothetical protein